ncbi:CobW/HypB/UreG, nucleotide-binding domain-containing protein [Pisolithus orientalis]|uniref:CobW/HypB/UreG, nucleotide-binding domain-containing protein n=1 Tax=Pisolithus orientalis TaxID=936130 RepID=UPI00222573C1|nr:CobW/HypB/UreG, nucleotide-binding domain-containing protein [Pisolithus orientalis]KAI6025779.1 CobW/HypB/UreG, nucleotide-binding domain-containing protein [Pisolithus orientalis]
MIPVTVFTGYLGAGKTTIILSLLPKLPKGYKAVLLKNEFGDTQVDSQLAKESNLAAVNEILNGCMCCVLVGQMKNALLDIRDNFRPDRIIIECSGSAFPATLAFQIRELERETNGDFKLDAIVTVIDAENFTGYEDTSPTARMQASYSDLILINKWEHLEDRALDLVLDHLNTLNDLTPKVRCNGRDGVDPNLIFGIDSKLFKDKSDEPLVENHHNEVQTITIFKGLSCALPRTAHSHGSSCRCCSVTESSEEISQDGLSPSDSVEESFLRSALEGVPKESVWRVKGLVCLQGGMHILNWAFGRYDLTKVDVSDMDGTIIRLTAMGERGEVRKSMRRFCDELQAMVV